MAREGNECTDGLAPNEYRWEEEDVLAAIENTGGNMSQIARNLGCSRTTAKRYVLGERGTDATEQAYNDECEKFLDIAEGVLLKAMTGADIKEAGKTARWLLNTKGKDRGYTSREEHEITKIADIRIVTGKEENEDDEFLPE